ncbi:MAG: VCBS repeat-containing protein [Candidatus Aenigmarchaeota archaeon]|nr:VCBS repeat-containing protein [Candidatus Aenigmarchaeota archaeon]
MLTKSCFLLLAFAALALLASSGPAGAAVEVSSCMELASADTTYILNRSLVNENVTDEGGWCMGITAGNVTLDCQGHAIANGTLEISGIYSNMTGTTIMNCNVSMSGSSGGYGIELSSSDGSSIINNMLNGQNYGLLLTSSDDTSIENNTASSNTGYGIILSSSSNNTVTGNTIWNCSSGGSFACVYIDESDGNVFSGNNISRSSGYGIWIRSSGSGDHSSNNIFMNTNMTEIGGTGVLLDDDGLSENVNNTYLNFTYGNETVETRSQLIRRWHYRALVTLPSGVSAPGVAVQAYNSSGALIENMTSGVTGWTAIGSLIDYVNSGGSKYSYSNYTVNVTRRGFIPGTETYNVSATFSNISDVISMGRFYSFIENSSLSSSTWSLAVADLDNDGYLDYIAGNFNQQNSIYMNNGLGSFTNTENSDESDATYSIAAADLNNDGYIDYIAGNYGQPNRVYLNDGSGSFILHENSTESNNTRSIAIADLDNDGYVDYIEGNSNQKNCIYINNGSGNFALLETSAESEGTFALAIGDLNGDGYPDYISGNYNQQNRIYINNGSGHFTSLETSAESDTTRSIAIADLDNDGNPDYIAGNEPSPNGHDRAYINNGSGHFTLNYTSLSQSATYGLAILDINHDGHLDYIAASVGPAKNRIYLSDGLSNFTLYESSEKKNSTYSVAVGDFDRDGDLDYIGGNSGENNLYFNNRDGSDYVIILIKAASPYINRDAIGTRVYASLGGTPVGYRDVTAADSSRDGALELHFGLASGSTYDINATFATGKMVSCSVAPPINFTMFENGTSTNGAGCYVVDFPPQILLMAPSDNTATMDMDINFSCGFSDDNMLTNVAIYVWNSTSDVYYYDTKAVSGTSNQSDWTLLSMTPDLYMWNCLVSDNASKVNQQPVNYSLRIVIKNSLYLKLVLNNTDSTVYIPGVGEQNSSTLPYQFYGSPEHYYLASYLGNALSGLVFSMRIPRGISVGRNASEGTHYIAVEQYMDDSRVFLVHTLGNWREIEGRIDMIETGRFLTNILPSFSYGLGNRYSLDLALGYADIDLQGKLMLRKGTHKIVLENNGTSGGKPVVVISRE